MLEQLDVKTRYEQVEDRLLKSTEGGSCYVVLGVVTHQRIPQVIPKVKLAYAANVQIFYLSVILSSRFADLRKNLTVFPH